MKKQFAGALLVLGNIVLAVPAITAPCGPGQSSFTEDVRRHLVNRGFIGASDWIEVPVLSLRTAQPLCRGLSGEDADSAHSLSLFGGHE